MKRYHFRLASVLRVRRIEEDRAAGELAAAQQHLQAATASLAARRADLDAIAAGPTGAVPASAFHAHRFRVDTAVAGVQAAMAAELVAATAAEEQRLAYVAAAARVSAIERLDERQREEHRLENDRLETLEVDDLVTGRAGRAVRAGAHR